MLLQMKMFTLQKKIDFKAHVNNFCSRNIIKTLSSDDMLNYILFEEYYNLLRNNFIFVTGELKSLSLPRGFLPELTEHSEQGN